MQHPFESIPPGKGKYGFVPALVFYAVIQLVFAWLDRALETASAPLGIVSFELAGNVRAAQGMVDSWNAFARLDAAFGLGLDFLFMVAYSTVIGIACIWAGRGVAAREWPLPSLGGLLAWGVWLAVLCDGTENVMLLGQLFYGVASPLPEIAAACATVKFGLIILGLLYMLYGTTARLVRRAARAASA